MKKGILIIFSSLLLIGILKENAFAEEIINKENQIIDYSTKSIEPSSDTTNDEKDTYKEITSSVENIVNGSILDYNYDNNKILYEDGYDIKLKDINSGNEELVFTMHEHARTDIVCAHLTSNSVIFAIRLNTSGRIPDVNLYEYKDGKLNHIDDLEVMETPKTNKDYVAWISKGKKLYLRNTRTDTTSMISGDISAYNKDVSEDGTVVFFGSSNEINSKSSVYKYSDGSLVKVSQDDSKDNEFPITDGNLVVYIRSGSDRSNSEIILNKNGNEEVLSKGSSTHKVRNGYVAYSKDVNGITQTFLMKDGKSVQMTFFEKGAHVEEVGENGEIIVYSESKYYLIQNKNINLIPSYNGYLTKAIWNGNELYILNSDKVLKINCSSKKEKTKINAIDMNIKVNDKFNPLENITASDSEGRSLIGQVRVVKNEVDTAKEGVYEVTYEVTDSEGETVSKTIKVIVRSNEKPVINASDKTINVGESFDPMIGITAVDKEDGDITQNVEVIENSVDIKNAGIYKVRYNVKDSDENIVSREIIVTVRSNEKPVVNLSDIKIKAGDEFDIMNGVTAMDKEDGDITSKVTVIGEVNLKKHGSYVVKYSVIDSDNNNVDAYRIVTVDYADEDVNKDDIIDFKDAGIVIGNLNKKNTDSRYNPNADINKDGIVDLVDLKLVINKGITMRRK